MHILDDATGILAPFVHGIQHVIHDTVPVRTDEAVLRPYAQLEFPAVLETPGVLDAVSPDIEGVVLPRRVAVVIFILEGWKWIPPQTARPNVLPWHPRAILDVGARYDRERRRTLPRDGIRPEGGMRDVEHVM